MVRICEDPTTACFILCEITLDYREKLMASSAENAWSERLINSGTRPIASP